MSSAGLFMPDVRATLKALEGSKIRDVANEGAGLTGVIPLWFGEPDTVTPEFIRTAAKAALDAGQTFYGPNLGIPALRAAIAAFYETAGCNVDEGRICVTASGVNALMLCSQAILEIGDEVLVPSPHWPHLLEIPRILGARTSTFGLTFARHGWTLDVDEFCSKITAKTRMVILNSPSNPTGSTLTQEVQEAILDRCRQTGTWILADEVYNRVFFDGERAPSFLDITVPADRVLVVNSFSKSWAMTGWRLGWIVAPIELIETLAKLNEYNMSSPPVFVQSAGIAAIEQGTDFLLETVSRYRAMRDLCVQMLGSLPRISMPIPQGGMYAFFQVDGISDSLALARDVLRKARVGLAPGAAFGPHGEGCLRLCFAGTRERLAQANERLADYFCENQGK